MAKFDRKQKNLMFNTSKTVSFVGWMIISHLGHLASLVLLAMVAWIELLWESAGAPNLIYLIPITVLILAFPMNFWLHQRFAKSGDEFESAHGFLSAVFPTK